MVSYVQLLGYVMLPFLFIWGLRMVYFNQRRYNTFFKMRFGIWVGAFIAASLLPIFFNITLSAIISVIMFFHTFICFFVFYGMHTEADFNFKNELYFCRQAPGKSALNAYTALTHTAYESQNFVAGDNRPRHNRS